METPLDPGRPIIDPHHHFWRHKQPSYLLEDLWRDTDTGHHVVKTVFVECGAEYRTDGPEAFKPLGEIEFATRMAAQSTASGHAVPAVAGIVGHADLRLGKRVGEVLDAAVELAPSLMKGIRHAAAWDADERIRGTLGDPAPDQYSEPEFREGFRELASRGLSFDAWSYHHALTQLTGLARANPDVTIIVDHFGGVVGTGPYAGRREEIKTRWKQDLSELAGCENVHMKLGGLAMPVNGFDWHQRGYKASSDELVAAQRDYYLFAIDAFSPTRCMFESNFPVDKVSIDYATLWNAFKKMTAGFSEDEKHALFYGTAERVYRLDYEE